MSDLSDEWTLIEVWNTSRSICNRNATGIFRIRIQLLLNGNICLSCKQFSKYGSVNFQWTKTINLIKCFFTMLLQISPHDDIQVLKNSICMKKKRKCEILLKTHTYACFGDTKIYASKTLNICNTECLCTWNNISNLTRVYLSTQSLDIL